MQGGISIGRQRVLVLKDGGVVIDWDDGILQDILSGEFLKYDADMDCNPFEDDLLGFFRIIREKC